MKRVLSIILVLALLCCTVSAAEGNVIYSGDSGDLIFQPGSEESLTDLFPNFKGVMPGDSLRQPITVRNDASNEVKVKIYIRALGAHEDSVEFLSQLRLRVAHAAENEMAYMFDAYASETAQLGNWVCLGMLYSGGEVNLEVILDVPVEMGNEFQEKIGYLDWEFRIEEFPVEPDDPTPPQTGDTTNLAIPAAVMLLCAAAIIVLIVLRRREKQGGDGYE